MTAISVQIWTSFNSVKKLNLLSQSRAFISEEVSAPDLCQSNPKVWMAEHLAPSYCVDQLKGLINGTRLRTLPFSCAKHLPHMGGSMVCPSCCPTIMSQTWPKETAFGVWEEFRLPDPHAHWLLCRGCVYTRQAQRLKLTCECKSI